MKLIEIYANNDDISIYRMKWTGFWDAGIRRNRVYYKMNSQLQNRSLRPNYKLACHLTKWSTLVQLNKLHLWIIPIMPLINWTFSTRQLISSPSAIGTAHHVPIHPVQNMSNLVTFKISRLLLIWIFSQQSSRTKSPI